jgi:voltage-dependent anion channel protein 2
MPPLTICTRQLEAKYKDDPTGTFFRDLFFQLRSPVFHINPSSLCQQYFFHDIHRGRASLLTRYRRAGLTLTQTWSTANSLDTKIELEDQIAKGLKAELNTVYLPNSNEYGAKVNVHFKQPNFHGRAFFDIFKGPVATVDAVLGHEGFLVGAEAGYDVQKAAITKYSAAVGYTAPIYSAAITASNNLSVFSASYYHKVNSQVEAGAKATWDSKAGSTVGLEFASKYRLDPTSFVKVRIHKATWRETMLNVLFSPKGKINDRGIAAVSYSVLLRPGFTLGLGASFDTQKLSESSHKVCILVTSIKIPGSSPCRFRLGPALPSMHRPIFEE